jgi:hypothetical protein
MLPKECIIDGDNVAGAQGAPKGDMDINEAENPNDVLLRDRSAMSLSVANEQLRIILAEGVAVTVVAMQEFLQVAEEVFVAPPTPRAVEVAEGGDVDDDNNDDAAAGADDKSLWLARRSSPVCEIISSRSIALSMPSLVFLLVV